MPRMPLNGVRISWLMFARNSLLALLARLACSAAACASAAAVLSWWFICSSVGLGFLRGQFGALARRDVLHDGLDFVARRVAAFQPAEVALLPFHMPIGRLDPPVETR